MIYVLSKTPSDGKAALDPTPDASSPFDYSNVIVKKPWGYEYLVFENSFVAIWMLQIVRKRKTSMHCHPQKRTGLVLLSGHAIFHHSEGSIPIVRMDAINIAEGAFHSTEANSTLPIDPVSENGIWVMEMESPPIKGDLCRVSDEYGRSGALYEGINYMVFDPRNTLKLEEPEEESFFCRTYQDLTFSMRKGPILEKYLPPPGSLISVVGRDPNRNYSNPFMSVGQVFGIEEFYKNTRQEDFSQTVLLTIEKKGKSLKLADYVASYLAGIGVKHVFAVCGGGAMHLVDSFGSSNHIEYIATHHEQAAAMAAESYARVTGQLGAALVTSGPGGSNAITGVYGAWVDSIPTIVISGQVTQDTLIRDTGLRQFGIQEGNIIDIVRPITKYAVTVTDPQSMRYHLEKACYLAMTGRQGPVWLDIPLDVQSKLINPEDQAGYTPDNRSPKENYFLRGVVSETINLLTQAKRPVLIYGYGVRLAKAEEELRRIVSRLGIPCISSWTTSDVIPSDAHEYVGRSGIMGDRAGNFAVQNSDLLLIVGSRMSIPQIGYNYKLFARAAQKIVVDIDEAELNKPSLKPDIPIKADAAEFLTEMSKQLDQKESRLDIDKWRLRCEEWKKNYPVVLPEYSDNKDRVNSFYFISLLSEKLTGDAVVVTDMGTSFTCTMQAFKTKAGQRLFTSSGFASMGFGLPGAIGACFANGMKKTVLIAGDGGLQMNIQELQTVVHYKLPLIMFILNNEGYLTIKLMQQNHFGRYIGSDPLSGLSCPDTLKLAAAYGIESERISNQQELENRLDSILENPGPYLCEIMMSPEQPLIPRVSSLKLPDGRIISKPLEDLYPFLDREEFRRNMIIEPVEILN